MRNPDHIDASLRQNDHDRDVTEWRHPTGGGCSGGCLSQLIDVLLALFVLYVVIGTFIYVLFNG